MKGKIAWLALPLVLCVLAVVADSRMKQPKLTQLDLRIRTSLSKFSGAQVSISDGRKYRFPDEVFIPIKELKPFVECFYLAPKQTNDMGVTAGRKGQLLFDFHISKLRNGATSRVLVYINVLNSRSRMTIWPTGKNYDVDTFTSKQWMELLLKSSRLSPELRKHLKG